MLPPKVICTNSTCFQLPSIQLVTGRATYLLLLLLLLLSAIPAKSQEGTTLTDGNLVFWQGGCGPAVELAVMTEYG